MVYINSKKNNIGDTPLKLGRILQKQKKPQVANEVIPVVKEPVEPPKTQETFREHYSLLIPHSYAAIVEDENKDLSYSLLEPTLTPLDEAWVNEIKAILWDELFINTKDFPTKKEAEEFLKTKVWEITRKYKIKIDLNTLGKYQYYITRDFLNFAKIDGIMRDENIEDVSCDGVGIPVFVWHRKYESIPTNIFFQTPEELENFIFKIAYLCGRHISIAQPLLDGTLPAGSRAQVTYGKEVSPKKFDCRTKTGR